MEVNVGLATEERTQRQRSGRGSVVGTFYLVPARVDYVVGGREESDYMRESRIG